MEERLKLLVIVENASLSASGGLIADSAKHEDVIQACIREVQEEVGLELTPKRSRTNDSSYHWWDPRVGTLPLLTCLLCSRSSRYGPSSRCVKQLLLDVDFKHGECS